MAQGRPIISIRDLEKIYKSKNSHVKALEHINLDVYEGEVFGIIGLSGAGKSTLVRCMNFLERPTAGTVFFDGKDLSQLTKGTAYCTSVHGHDLSAVQPVDAAQFHRQYLLSSGDRGHGEEPGQKRAYELLEVVGLSDKANAYPAQLSGGQKQRVAIARALATNPKVLLCDEATSALDPATTHSILGLLKQINKDMGLTIVVITHEMSVIEEICQRIAIIDDSRIVEMGNVIDIFTNPKTEIAKSFASPGGDRPDRVIGNRLVQIIFDGNSSYEPVLAKTILECKAPVNIMFADTKNIDGRAFGQMIIQLPEDENLSNRVLAYLRTQDIIVKEVEASV